jgi:F0F1-type ATP synthase assembly protein I
MWRMYLIIALVLGFIVGGLLLLKSSAKTRVPPELIERARQRNAERAARGEKDDD